jgi:hypothetical protein
VKIANYGAWHYAVLPNPLSRNQPSQVQILFLSPFLNTQSVLSVTSQTMFTLTHNNRQKHYYAYININFLYSSQAEKYSVLLGSKDF